MIGFALSKLNLLILVTALFAIVIFFTYNLDGISIGSEASRIVRKNGRTMVEVLESDQLCIKREISLQPYIRSLYAGQVYYIMNLRKIESAEESTLVVEVTRRPARGEKKPVMASQRIDSDAEFLIFDFDRVTNSLEDADKTTLDPQSREPVMDSLIIIKEIYHGEKKLYLIPCTSHYEGSCLDNEQTVGNMVKAERGMPSTCILSET